MRVYEFAKKHDIPSKSLLGELKAAGFDVGNHMSVLDDKAKEFLEKKFKLGVAKIKATPTPKKEAPKKVIAKQPVKQKAAPQPKRPPVKKEQRASIIQEEKVPAKLIVQPMTPAGIADAIGQPANEVILTLLKWGVIAAKNQVVSEDVVKRLADHYMVEAVRPERKEEKGAKEEIIVKGGSFKERAPVVVVLGHVDHGKTTLLDFIRNTRVASREKGGITQHLGAYEAKTDQGNIVFLDTPGHEAFSKIRMRGVKVADIAILMVAADDGVMPQTIEAIKFAKSMDVPIVVAINKIDRVDESRIQAVKQGLVRHELVPEDWGGEVVCVPISAKTGKNVDQLLEMLTLQAQILELTAESSGPAKGYVLESKLEKGRGPVATLLSQHGVVRIGDYFVCGSTWGRISSLVDSYGKRLKEVGPGIPVQVAGFDELPDAGDYFEVVAKADIRKARSAGMERKAPVAMRITSGDAVKLIVKTDTNSTKEALLESIDRLSKKFDRPFNIIQSGVGDVSEGDVMLAADTGSFIYGLHVRVEPNAASLAQQLKVSTKLYNIIYKLLEGLEEYMESTKAVVMVRAKTGEAEVRKVFNIKGVGVIAGCYLKDGKFSRDGIIVGWRGTTKVGEGKIKSLQRDKKTVKEVHAGYEFAFMLDNVDGWEVGDRVECYIEAPEK